MGVQAILKCGVIGAGQMGGGIAQVAAASGLEVLLSDANRELADKGKERLGQQLGRQVAKGRMTEDEASAVLKRIATVDDVSAFSEVDIVVEAATENFDLKRKIFVAADRALKPGAILASNTSSISITKLAAAAQVEHL